MSIRFISTFALALTLAFCGGCDDKKFGSVSPSCRNTFSPLVTKDATVAFGMNLDKDQAFKVVDAYSNLVADFLGPKKEDEVKDIKEKIAAYKKDLFADLDPKSREFVEKSGLRDADIRWAVASVENLKIANGEPQLDGMSLAIGGKVDLEKLISVCLKEPNANVSLEEVKIDGEAAWRIVPRDDKTIKDMEKVRANPHVTSLDGQLVLIAMSRDTLAKQIRLYRDGNVKGDALDGFSAGEGELSRLCISGIGDLLRKNTSRSDFKMVRQFVPDVDKLVYGLRSLTVDTKVRPDGMFSDSLLLETASEKDADHIRTLAKTGLMAATAQMSKRSDIPMGVRKMIEAVKVGGADGKVEIQCGSFGVGVGVLAGALFPAISSAMLNANTAAMAMRGRKLFVGLIQANVEREAAGLDSVWPRTVSAAGADEKGICKSATAYFNHLFEMENYGKSDWNPNVKADIGTLGKDAVVGNLIDAGGLEWCVAANVTDDLPDHIPVLISANFNPAVLLRKWDGKTDGSVRLPIGPASGAAKSMFGDKAIVVVYKGGSSIVIQKKFLTYNTLYNKHAFDLNRQNPPLVYLTPNGVVEPAGRK